MPGKKGNRVYGGIKFGTQKITIGNFNVLEVEAGTNGLHDGDTGNGCRGYFRIEDTTGGANFEIKPIYAYMDYPTTSGFSFKFGGDEELESIIAALKYITKVLEKQKNPPHGEE